MVVIAPRRECIYKVKERDVGKAAPRRFSSMVQALGKDA